MNCIDRELIRNRSHRQ